VLTFYHCDKIPKKIITKRGGFILAHGCRNFSLWLFGSIVSGHVIRQYLMVEGRHIAKLLISCWPGGMWGREREREREEGEEREREHTQETRDKIEPPNACCH
jgi:hypothetical protein